MSNSYPKAFDFILFYFCCFWFIVSMIANFSVYTIIDNPHLLKNLIFFGLIKELQVQFRRSVAELDHFLHLFHIQIKLKDFQRICSKKIISKWMDWSRVLIFCRDSKIWRWPEMELCLKIKWSCPDSATLP